MYQSHKLSNLRDHPEVIRVWHTSQLHQSRTIMKYSKREKKENKMVKEKKRKEKRERREEAAPSMAWMLGAGDKDVVGFL